MVNKSELSQEELVTNETISLIAADKVEGTPVYNADDEKLGTVDKLMIDKVSGRVSYAVMSFGGFLGRGRELSPAALGRLDLRCGEGRICDLPDTRTA